MTRKSTLVTRSSPGMMKNRPGPRRGISRPRRKTTPLSYSLAIFTVDVASTRKRNITKLRETNWGIMGSSSLSVSVEAGFKLGSQAETDGLSQEPSSDRRHHRHDDARPSEDVSALALGAASSGNADARLATALAGATCVRSNLRAGLKHLETPSE